MLRILGVRTCFVSRYLPESARGRLAAEGHEFELLPEERGQFYDLELAHSEWLGVGQAKDAEATLKVLSDKLWDWVVVDHYGIDYRWESRIRAVTSRIMVIDDIADRKHDCDILLDQNLHCDMEARYAKKIPVCCQLLLGPRFALLREEFQRMATAVQPRSGTINRMLISFGGVDAENVTGMVIDALRWTGMVDIKVDVVIGAQHPAREQIRRDCSRLGYEYHVQTEKMAELMRRADLAIGATGVSTWERAALGLPTLAVSVAENQRDIARYADRAGILTWLGDADRLSVEEWGAHILSARKSALSLRLQSQRCLSMVDANGAMRVIEAML